MAVIANVILVHGAWADGSSWAKVIPLLAAKGLAVTAVQLPLTSFDADVAAVLQERYDRVVDEEVTAFLTRLVAKGCVEIEDGS